MYYKFSFFCFRKFNDSSVTFAYSFLTTFQSLVSTITLGPTSHSKRLLWSAWLIFGILLSNSLVGTLVTRILNKKATNNIQTIDDLFEADIPILFRGSSSLLRQVNNTVINKLVDKAQRDSKRKPRASITTTFFRMYLDSINIDGSHDYYKIPECVYRDLSGYTMLYEHPLYSVFHSLINKFIEAGFYEKWLSEYKFNISIKKEDSFYYFNTTKKVLRNPFSLADLTPAFYFYSFGMVISFVVFIFEKITFFWQNKLHQIPYAEW